MPTFDFAALQTRIVTASVEAFADVARLSPKDPVCSFALYSDEDAMTVCPAFDTRDQLAARLAKRSGELAFKYCPPEWAYESVGADKVFNAISDDVRTFVMRDDTNVTAFRDELFETCMRALDEMRGRFGPEILFMFDVSDSDIPKTMQLARLERLNPGSPHLAEFRRWATTW